MILENLVLDQLMIPQLIFSLFPLLFCLILYWYCKEKFCLGHSWELKGWRDLNIHGSFTPLASLQKVKSLSKVLFIIAWMKLTLIYGYHWRDRRVNLPLGHWIIPCKQEKTPYQDEGLEIHWKGCFCSHQLITAFTTMSIFVWMFPYNCSFL